jgi:hypothetical protein
MSANPAAELSKELVLVVEVAGSAVCAALIVREVLDRL